MRWRTVSVMTKSKTYLQVQESLRASILLCNVPILRLFLPCSHVKQEIMVVVSRANVGDGRSRDNLTGRRTPDNHAVSVDRCKVACELQR